MKRYYLEFFATLAAYAVTLIGSIWVLLGAGIESRAGQALVALSPMIPGGLMCWVILRQMRRVDELQRRIQLEALACAFAATALLTFSYGFLEGVGYPRLSMFVVWPVMAVSWTLGLVFASWRYR